ncbi:MAG: UbiA family prenyltransferase [Planctomycetota bacterium]
MSRDESQRGSPGGLTAWLQLIRLPNVFTVLADVGAAFLLVAGGPHPTLRFVVVLLAGVALYWSGMVLNDVFDVEKDRRERSSRPIASGAISIGSASRAGWALLVIGLIFAAISGYLPGGGDSTWLPAVIGILLAAMIVAYDGPLKSTPLAPAAMGSCRVLSFLLGASPVLPLVDSMPSIPTYLLGIAFGFGVYVMGITTLARDEALGGKSMNLKVGFGVLLVGVILLAVAPDLASAQQSASWRWPSGQRFYILIAACALPVTLRGIRLLASPTGPHLGQTIRVGLLSIISLSAAFATLGAGPRCGIAVLALVVPAMILATRLRVT